MPSKLMPAQFMSRHVHFMPRHVLWLAVLSGSCQVPAGAEHYADDSDDVEACCQPVVVRGVFWGGVVGSRGSVLPANPLFLCRLLAPIGGLLCQADMSEAFARPPLPYVSFFAEGSEGMRE